MGILSWVQSKVSNTKPLKKKKRTAETLAGSGRYQSVPETCKEEFNDWPHELLAIGTFGNSGMTGDSQRYTSSESSRSSQNLSNFTVEEVYKLQKELTRQLALKSKSGSYERDMGSGRKADLPLDKFLNCPSSLEIERRVSGKVSENQETEDGDISPNTRMILLKVKDVLSGKHNSVNQKSFSFLLKKMFVCGGGFPRASIKDPIPETKMEKLLRTIIQKKLFSRYCTPPTRTYLEKKPTEEKGSDDDDDARESTDSGCRWVKTDSEYIVLEI